MQVLQVRGRKRTCLLDPGKSSSGRWQPLSGGSARNTQWVRNAEASGESFSRGKARTKYRVRPIADSEKPE